METIKSLLYQCISLPEGELFDKLMEKINDYSYNLDYKINDLKVIKKNKNKVKGDLFELICIGLIRNNSIKSIKCKEAWLFKELPADLRKKLYFNNAKDVGIDIVVNTTSDQWIAVQCKYRSKPKHKSITINKEGEYKKINLKWQVTWADLSTFYSLCARTGINETGIITGGWAKHVVMTTAESVNRQGRKNEKDVSICIGTFRGISKSEWFKLLGDEGNVIGNNIDNTDTVGKIDNIIYNLDMSKLSLDDPIDIPDINLIREKRLLLLEKK